MNKAEIYQQINEFNKAPVNPQDNNFTSRADAFYYVPEAVAAERARFFRFLLTQPPFSNISLDDSTVLDLAFGSGSLTTHLVLDGEVPYQRLLLNDKVIDTANRELATLLDRTEVSKHDFLDANQFSEVAKAQLVVFNPQTGGRGDRVSGLESFGFMPVVYSGELADYLSRERKRDTSALTFNKNDLDRKIQVHSDTLTKSELKEIVGDVAVFNYYDVFWQSKETKVEGSATNVVRFRNTFDRVFDPQGMVVFYGELSFFRSLFADFNHVAELCAPDEGKNLFVAARTDGSQVHQRYQKQGDTYVPVDNCQGTSNIDQEAASLDTLEVDIDALMKDLVYSSDEDSPIKLGQAPEEVLVKARLSFQLSTEPKGKLDFPYRNILLKGVPGTGKSRLINESLIRKELELASINDSNVLRINVHSASSNADLMQGIGITSVGGQIEYREKQGLILKHLQRAIAHPHQPFAIVLEEIQENSLNELIGDLIYLIEGVKRVDLKQAIDSGVIDPSEEYESLDHFLETLSRSAQELHYVEVPYLVSTETRYKKMIIPANLYLFCTSNYRDDKKVIEDNLLRRFDVIEVYPKYKESIGEAFEAQEVSDFLKTLNEAILTHFKGKEIHPDRFMIGHAIWLNASDASSFCRALLKTITEFKDVRELDYHEDVEPIFSKIASLPFGLDANELLKGSYQEIINTLQQQAYGSLLNG